MPVRNHIHRITMLEPKITARAELQDKIVAEVANKSPKKPEDQNKAIAENTKETVHKQEAPQPPKDENKAVEPKADAEKPADNK